MICWPGRFNNEFVPKTLWYIDAERHWSCTRFVIGLLDGDVCSLQNTRTVINYSNPRYGLWTHIFHGYGQNPSLNTESCHDVNSVVTTGSTSCGAIGDNTVDTLTTYSGPQTTIHILYIHVNSTNNYNRKVVPPNSFVVIPFHMLKAVAVISPTLSMKM